MRDDEDDDIRTPIGAEMAGMLIKRTFREAARHARMAIEQYDSLREEIGEEAYREMLDDPDPRYDCFRELERDLPANRRIVALYEELRSRDESN
jgi:hypothetical protein